MSRTRWSGPTTRTCALPGTASPAEFDNQAGGSHDRTSHAVGRTHRLVSRARSAGASAVRRAVAADRRPRPGTGESGWLLNEGTYDVRLFYSGGRPQVS